MPRIGPTAPASRIERGQEEGGLEDPVPRPARHCDGATRTAEAPSNAITGTKRANRRIATTASGDSTTVTAEEAHHDGRDQEGAQQRPPAGEGEAVGAAYADLGAAVDLAERVGGGRQHQQDARPEHEEGQQRGQQDPEAAALATRRSRAGPQDQALQPGHQEGGRDGQEPDADEQPPPRPRTCARPPGSAARRPVAGRCAGA